MNIPILNFNEVIQKLKVLSPEAHQKYLAFYSSFFGGICTDPNSLLIPLDDHMVHRGDGVFEAFKAIEGQIYLLEEHLDRLYFSAQKIHLQVPISRSELSQIILQTAKVASQKNLMFRLFLSRGPGGFSVNPYDSKQAQIYLVVMALPKSDSQKYVDGAKCGWSQIIQKPYPWAQIKSCNYLPNVLMKKEAVDRGLDVVISLDEKGGVAEGATENIIIIDSKNNLRIPPLDHILSGTVMIRLQHLVQNQLSQFGLQKCIVGPIQKSELMAAREVMIVGTTYDVMPVVQMEGQKINDGKVGPLAKQFRQMILDDQKKGPCVTTI